MIAGVTHVALRVEDLREAEEYYREPLDLEVAFRDAPADGGWAPLRVGARTGRWLEVAG